MPLSYWGRELVLWRDAGGEFHLQDAFCPHLGAHIGHGGRVEGDTILCPFHEWEFDGSGACTRIPYSERTNRRARLRTYPVIVRNGFVLAWYHPFDEPPQWEIPVIEEIGDPAWSDFYSSEYTIRTVPQEMSENGADPAHFRYVHGTDTVAEVEKYETDGPCSVMLSKHDYVTPRETTLRAVEAIKAELRERIDFFHGAARLVEAQRIEQRTRFDLEMLVELGFCKGIENYSRHLSGRRAGEPPPTLIDYLPQIGRAHV